MSTISDLQTAAGQAGDIMQAAICAVALGADDTSDYPLSTTERARLATYTTESARAECEREIAAYEREIAAYERSVARGEDD